MKAAMYQDVVQIWAKIVDGCGNVPSVDHKPPTPTHYIILSHSLLTWMKPLDRRFGSHAGPRRFLRNWLHD